MHVYSCFPSLNCEDDNMAPMLYQYGLMVLAVMYSPKVDLGLLKVISGHNDKPVVLTYMSIVSETEVTLFT